LAFCVNELNITQYMRAGPRAWMTPLVIAFLAVNTPWATLFSPPRENFAVFLVVSQGLVYLICSSSDYE